MKKSNILPFGDWFKVYESTGSNFKKSQILLESKVFESESNNLIAGGELPKLSGLDKYKARFEKAKSEIKKRSGKESVESALDDIKKLLAIDGKFIVYPAISGDGLGASNMKLDPTFLLASFVAVKAGATGTKINEIIDSLNFSANRDDQSDIKLTPAKEGFISTIGRIKSVGGIPNRVDNEGIDTTSSYRNLQGYINQHNMAAEYIGGTTYDKDSIEKGFFNLEKAFGPTNGDPIIFLSSTYEGGSVERSDEELVDVVGAEPAQVGQSDIKFQQATLEKGGATILPSEAPKIEALAKTIQKRFAGKTIDNFELISSASPEYGAIKNEQGWETKYPSTTGTGDPGVGTSDATNNMKLAYERGVSFMKAFNAKLNEMGHPGFATYQVKWQIASQGGPADDGRFVDLQISTNEKKGTVVKTTDVKGNELKASAKGAGRAESILYAYQIKVN